MPLEEQLLTASLTDTFHATGPILDKLYRLALRSNEEVEDEPDEVKEAAELLGYYVEKAFRDVSILAERLGLPLLARQITKSRSKIKHIDETTVLPDEFTFHSPPLQIARNYFDSLQVMTRGRDITGIGIFENVLKNAGKIMKARKLEPKNEKEVRNQIREALSFSFPDVVKEIPIEKPLKTYHPDIGVTSLMAAAEVKFAVNKEEAKAALDGIYTDMKGYSGRDEWRSFYAVIYMTEFFYTQEEVEREFRLVKAELSWTPFVVLGPGARKGKPVVK